MFACLRRRHSCFFSRDMWWRKSNWRGRVFKHLLKRKTSWSCYWSNKRNIDSINSCAGNCLYCLFCGLSEQFCKSEPCPVPSFAGFRTLKDADSGLWKIQRVSLLLSNCRLQHLKQDLCAQVNDSSSNSKEVSSWENGGMVWKSRICCY